MFEKLVPSAAEAFGVTYIRQRKVQKGYRNEIYPLELESGEMVQITFFKPEPGSKSRIVRADTVSQHAASKGLPARTRLQPSLACFTSAKRTVYAGLYTYLDGHTISWEAYTKEHLKSLGKAMSDLHAALQDYHPAATNSVIDESSRLLDRMQAYFSNANVQSAMQQKLGLSLTRQPNWFDSKLQKTRQLPGQQLHMDFVRGNLLFNDQAALVGLLDFEKTAYGPVVYDIARTLAFLLVDCKYKTEQEVRRYFLRSGYSKRGAAALPLLPNTLETLVEFYLLHDFYKMLLHTPYESLSDNEHFTRTVAILAERNMVHYS